MKHEQVDFIIIGQGLAGSLLAWHLLKANKKILVVDSNDPNASSRVSAGLVNPITGRRFAKSWMVDTLLPFAEQTYREMEEDLSSRFYFRKNILEVVQKAGDLNQWLARSGDPLLENYFGNSSRSVSYLGILKKYLRLIEIKSSGWMNAPLFLSSFRKKLIAENLLIENNLSYDGIDFSGTTITYNDIESGGIIFCEGHRAADNPLWNWLPFSLVKGELLTIHAKDLPEEFILLSGIFILPLGNQLFRVGSTYVRDQPDDVPTQQARNHLIDKLEKLLAVPFTLIDHKAGIRPAVTDRRPLIGRHPQYHNAFIFNGLGTKGVLLGPYFAKQAADFVRNKSSVDEEADLSRFYPLFSLQSSKTL